MVLRITESEIRLLGALLLIFSCASMGIAAEAALRKAVRDTEKTIRITERMRLEVCLRRRSLIEAMSILETEYPHTRLEGLRLAEKPFSEIWGEYISAVGLPDVTEEAITELGTALANGADPETAFRSCRERLCGALNQQREDLKNKVKVYIDSGFAAGCLMAIASI